MIESRSTDSPAQLFPALLNFPRQDSDCLFFNKQTGFTTLLNVLVTSNSLTARLSYKPRARMLKRESSVVNGNDKNNLWQVYRQTCDRRDQVVLGSPQSPSQHNTTCPSPLHRRRSGRTSPSCHFIKTHIVLSTSYCGYVRSVCTEKVRLGLISRTVPRRDQSVSM